MLIRAYGLFWNPDIVDWGKPGKGNKGLLQGRVKKDDTTHTIDFWDTYGIYVLHNEFKAIYVGQAAATRLGSASKNDPPLPGADPRASSRIVSVRASFVDF